MNKTDWDNWQAEITATLLFIIKDGKILLIKKKRGLGAGKINGPGGKIDPGETPLQCALRETQEELHITAKNPVKVAELWFEMSDHPSLLCHVFTSTDFEGTPTETDEAIPMWVPLDEIPYAKMWEDDQYWLPQILNGETLLGKFSFDGDRMITREILPLPATS